MRGRVPDMNHGPQLCASDLGGRSPTRCLGGEQARFTNVRELGSLLDYLAAGGGGKYFYPGSFSGGGGRPAVRGKRTYGGRPGQRVEEQGTWASRTQKPSEAG